MIKLVTLLLLALMGSAAIAEGDPRYYVDGKLARVIEDGGLIEIRLIPGWQLDPACPPEKWGEDCNGGQGFLLFHGVPSDEFWDGEARLDHTGCDKKWFIATIRKTKKDWLILTPADGSKKCRAVLKPASVIDIGTRR
jgi:hypothetical protein